MNLATGTLIEPRLSAMSIDLTPKQEGIRHGCTGRTLIQPQTVGKKDGAPMICGGESARDETSQRGWLTKTAHLNKAIG